MPFRFASEIKPFPSKGDGALIAPYLADADTSGIGDIYYRHITDPNDSTLSAISKDITDSNFNEFTKNSFNAKMAIIATWYQVGYFHGHSDKVCNVVDTHIFYILMHLPWWEDSFSNKRIHWLFQVYTFYLEVLKPMESETTDINKSCKTCYMYVVVLYANFYSNVWF